MRGGPGPLDMSCIAPTVGRGGHEFPCHKCIGCRHANRLRRQTAIEAEALCWPVALFSTLTFSDDKLPSSAADVDSCVRWFRRGAPFRALVVFERGSVTERPHLHAICFGSDEVRMLAWHDRWRDRHGFVKVEPFSPASAGYIVKYLSKSARSARFEVEHSDGLGPERAYWLRRPAAGVKAAERFAAVVAASVDLRSQFEVFADVPKVIKLFGSLRVIPDRIRVRMRELFGLPRVDPFRAEIQKEIASYRKSDPQASAMDSYRRAERYRKLRIDETSALCRRFGIPRVQAEAERRSASARVLMVSEDEFPASLGEVPTVKRGQ